MASTEQTGQSSKVKFEEYSWEEDDEWQVLINKLEFPATFDEARKAKHILKRKQKYFKANVDPDFKPTISTSRPKPPTPPQPEQNPHDPEPDPQPEPTSSTSTSSNTNTNTSSSSSYSNYSRNPYGTYQPPPTYIGRILSPFLNYFYFICQVLTLLCCLASPISPTYHYRALYATLLSYGVNTIHSNGKPQLNMYYAQRIMQDSSLMVAVYAAMMLLGPPTLILLSPLLLRSLWMACYLLNGLLNLHAQWAYRRLRPTLQTVLTRMAWFNATIAWFEVGVGVFLIGACFVLSRTVMVTFMYWQVMHARYMMDAQIRAAFAGIHVKMQGYLGRVPAVLGVYMRVTGWLWNMVDPERLQEQMQSGGGGGIASGLMKKCVVM